MIQTSLRKQRRGKHLVDKTRRKMLFEPLENRQMLAADLDHDHSDHYAWEASINRYIPAAQSKIASGAPLSNPSTADKLTIAKNYLKSNASYYGVTPADFDHSIVTSSYVSQHNGVTHIYLQQTFNDLPIRDAVASVSIMSNGQVISAASNFIAGLQHPATPTNVQPAIEASYALYEFGRSSTYMRETEWKSIIVNADTWNRETRIIVSNPEELQDVEFRAGLHYVPKRNGGLQLAWNITHIFTFDGEHAYDVSIGAEPGADGYQQVIAAADWVAHATYQVFPYPAENPSESAQVPVVDPQHAGGSPFGWHDTDGLPGNETTNTTGNNVRAQDDAANNNDNPVGRQPDGGAGLVFNYPYNANQAPASYVDAAVVHLFYAVNVLHDVFYMYGFDEASGNFQQTNYTGQGAGNDAVRADAQDGSGTNNANFATPPDGTPPRMQQYIWTDANPDRDSSLDNVVIAHEYTHGISIRLTGGPMDVNSLDAIQSAAMGEGYGDFVGLWMTQVPGEGPNTPRDVGNWLQNGTGGIRRKPYSVDMNIQPLTYGDYTGQAGRMHTDGEIWAATLWDLNWALINKYGYSTDLYEGTAGNNIAMQLVIDGMKLQPSNPTMLEARDAILAADMVNNGGANFMDIWRVFARRGMGFSADDGGSADSRFVIEAFDLPPGISGTVYVDMNANGNYDAGDQPLPGAIVYHDANNNGVFDSIETSVVSGADGSYLLAFATSAGNVTIRQVVNTVEFVQSEPGGNGSYVINVSGGGLFSGYDFGNKEKPGEIRGIKFHDYNGNGVQDPGEPGMGGVYIYVDYNNSGNISILEPAGVTAADGSYRIINVRPGTWNVREVYAPGTIATYPAADDVAGTPAGMWGNVVVPRGGIVTNIGFGNMTAYDWGDAPDSYGTTYANNGPRHAYYPGFGLGGSGDDTVAPEANGQPDSAANLDTLDNGIRLGPMTPGAQSTVYATASTAGRSPGYLQGWIDFNQNGKFEPEEHVIKDFRLLGSTLETAIPFIVPADANLGGTYARFRYGYERGSDASPYGLASIGEVEDYYVELRDVEPVAIDDLFIVKQDSSNNPLNILANDVGSSADAGNPPQFSRFASTTTANGGTITFDPVTNMVIYTPPADFFGEDSFDYYVVDSLGNESVEPGTVLITVAPADPIAIDDTYTVAIDSLFPTPGPHPNRFNVLANDIPGSVVRIASVTPIGSAPSTAIRISPDQRTLEFQPPAGFQGTYQYQYTITDDDPLTSDRSAIVTVQVTPDQNTPADDHVAALTVILVNESGVPGGPINVNEMFTVVVFAQDLRPFDENDPAGDDFGDRGVQAAYMDILYNSAVARLLRQDELPAGQKPIELDPNYDDGPLVAVNRPGIVNEVGGFYGEFVPPGVPAGLGPNPMRVATLRFRATAPGNLDVKLNPAESPPSQAGRSDVLLQDSSDGVPNRASDDEVFLGSVSTTIGTGLAAEGEFTNNGNSYDVDGDGFVTPLDALIVINDLNDNGGRDLSSLWSAAAGPVPEAYVDVDRDGFTTPLDALIVINWLNTNTSQPGGEAEGEGESAASSLAAISPVVESPLADSPVSDSSAGEGEGESVNGFVASVLTQQTKSTTTSSAAKNSDDVPPPSYGGLDISIIDLLMADDEEEPVTGSNSSDEGDSVDLFDVAE